MYLEPMTAGELVALVNDWGTLPRRVGAREVPDGDDLTVVADRLHPVFAAASPAVRARLVNAMLAETAVRPVVRLDASAWSVPRKRDALLASAALALRDHLAAYPDRLGVCADGQCADVYVDASPAGHRRFCSVTCQNRTRVAAYRRRHRQPAS